MLGKQKIGEKKYETCQFLKDVAITIDRTAFDAFVHLLYH